MGRSFIIEGRFVFLLSSHCIILLLNENSFLYPHEHAHGSGGTNGPFDGNEDTLLVITRDVFTWLPKMYEEGYDPIINSKRDKLDFSAFIRAPYTNVCHDGENNALLSVDKICESAENIIQIRTLKYKQWLSSNPDPATYWHGGYLPAK